MAEAFGRRFPQVHVDREVIHNGVDLDKFSIAPGKESAGDVAFIAHLNYRKNPALLLQIAAALKARGSQRRVFVAGEWQSGELQEYFEYMVRQMGLQDHVIMDGWVRDIPHWLDDKRYLLTTSMHESFGYCVFEGMAAGLRPVVHNYPGAREFLPPQYVFSTVAEAVGMLDADAGRPQVYRDFVAEHFPRRRQVQHVVDMLESLVGLNAEPALVGTAADGSRFLRQKDAPGTC
jgi:glycosyltransferase involved in cell wall biosynthesis